MHEEAAAALFEAWSTRAPIAPLTESYPDIDADAAYAIQMVLNGKRIAAGDRVIGHKIGLTSRAVQRMLNVDQPDFGTLLGSMAHGTGAVLSMADFIAPRVEGEIAFVLRRDLGGPGVTNSDVLAATEGVMACFEIVDSRIRDWRIRFEDTVADNASCGAIVLPDRLTSPFSVDLSLCGMVMRRNGEIVGTGAGADALGSPVNAVAWLANTLCTRGTTLRAGEVVLSGALSVLLPVAAGDSVHVAIGGIGECWVRFA